MGTMSVILYICDKIFLKILLSIIFYGVDVNLQNNYAIELMKWVVYETRSNCFIGSKTLGYRLV